MRKGFGVLMLAVSCSLVFMGCNKNENSKVTEAIDKMSLDGNAPSKEADIETEMADDTETEEYEDIIVDVEDLPAFKEFLSDNKGDVDNLNDHLSYAVSKMNAAGIKIDINSDIGIENNNKGYPFLVWKNLNKYDKSWNNKYYDGYYDKYGNMWHTSSFVDLMIDKFNVLNNKKRDIEKLDAVDEKFFLPFHVSDNSENVNLAFAKFMDSREQPDKELNDNLKEILGEKYDDVTKAVKKYLSKASYDSNILNMIDSEGKELGVAVVQEGDQIYYLIGALDGEKLTGHEYLLYYIDGDKYQGDTYVELSELAGMKAGPNGGGHIDEKVYKFSD